MPDATNDPTSGWKLLQSVPASRLLLVFMVMMPGMECHVLAEDPTVEQAYKYLQEGGRINADQVQEMEARLEADARNLPDRLRLVGYFQSKAGLGNMSSDGPGAKALVGLIERHPTFELAADVTSRVLPPAFDEAARQWLAVAAANPKDAAIVGNAGVFLTNVVPHFQTKHVGEGKV